MIWLAVVALAVAVLLFLGGVIAGIALCIWADRTPIHGPLQ